MSLSEFLANLAFDNEYFKQIDLLTKESLNDLKLSLEDNNRFSDYSREFGHFTIYSLLNLEKNKSVTRTFLPARKRNNHLYYWNKNPYSISRAPLKVGEEFMIFYNEFGKPYKAFLENQIVDKIGFNSSYQGELWSYEEKITMQDVFNAKNGYFIFLEVFQNKPFSLKCFDKVNFIFHGNSPLIDKKELIYWAKLNGLNSVSNKQKQGFLNVTVNLSNFPYTPKSILLSKIPVGLKQGTLKISLKDFINIAYNISYKENFVFSWDLLIKERIGFLEANCSYFSSMKESEKNKRFKDQVVRELTSSIEELKNFNL